MTVVWPLVRGQENLKLVRGSELSLIVLLTGDSFLTATKEMCLLDLSRLVHSEAACRYWCLIWVLCVAMSHLLRSSPLTAKHYY